MQPIAQFLYICDVELLFSFFEFKKKRKSMI